MANPHKPPHDLILHKPERALADDAGCTVAEVHAVLDRHPITVDRDKYLKRALAMQLLQLDQLEVAFREKAFVDRDVPAGMLLVKLAERRATLLGLNAPIGHAVAIIQPPAAANRKTSMDALARSFDRLGKWPPAPTNGQPASIPGSAVPPDSGSPEGASGST
jgi:hypothetical protein